MQKPDFSQAGDMKEKYEAIYSRKDKIRDYTFGISSAVGIVTGCIYGLSTAKGLYENVLFFLFFGCFLGSLFGAFFTILVTKLHLLLL